MHRVFTKVTMERGRTAVEEHSKGLVTMMIDSSQSYEASPGPRAAQLAWAHARPPSKFVLPSMVRLLQFARTNGVSQRTLPDEVGPWLRCLAASTSAEPLPASHSL